MQLVADECIDRGIVHHLRSEGYNVAEELFVSAGTSENAADRWIDRLSWTNH